MISGSDMRSFSADSILQTCAGISSLVGHHDSEREARRGLLGTRQ